MRENWVNVKLHSVTYNDVFYNAISFAELCATKKLRHKVCMLLTSLWGQHIKIFEMGRASDEDYRRTLSNLKD